MTGSNAAHGTASILLEEEHGTTARTGEAIPGEAVGANNIPSRVFCIPLLSGIVGVLQS